MRQVHVQRPALRRIAVLWCVVAALLAGCGSARYTDRPVAPVPGQPVPASAIPRLTAIADRAVKMNGGDAPEWATTAVVTTHKQALTSATPGDTVPIGEKAVVYLVTMKGHFVDGQYISLVLNARTFQGMDAGLATKPPPVAPASLGPVTYLKVTAHRRPGPLPSPRCPPGASCPPPPPPVTFTTTINGRTASRRLAGPVPSFRVRPGEHLQMQVTVTVPRYVRVTALWVGICHDSWGWGAGDRPTGMDPILTYSRHPSAAGMRALGMGWRVPEAHSAASVYLCAAWLSQQPPSGSAGAIAVLAVH
jgi:hypothetical protein